MIKKIIDAVQFCNLKVFDGMYYFSDSKSLKLLNSNLEKIKKEEYANKTRELLLNLYDYRTLADFAYFLKLNDIDLNKIYEKAVRGAESSLERDLEVNERTSSFSKSSNDLENVASNVYGGTLNATHNANANVIDSALTHASAYENSTSKEFKKGNANCSVNESLNVNSNVALDDNENSNGSSFNYFDYFGYSSGDATKVSNEFGGIDADNSYDAINSLMGRVESSELEEIGKIRKLFLRNLYDEFCLIFAGISRDYRDYSDHYLKVNQNTYNHQKLEEFLINNKNFIFDNFEVMNVVFNEFFGVVSIDSFLSSNDPLGLRKVEGIRRFLGRTNDYSRSIATQKLRTYYVLKHICDFKVDEAIRCVKHTYVREEDLLNAPFSLDFILSHNEKPYERQKITVRELNLVRYKDYHLDKIMALVNHILEKRDLEKEGNIPNGGINSKIGNACINERHQVDGNHVDHNINGKALYSGIGVRGSKNAAEFKVGSSQVSGLDLFRKNPLGTKRITQVYIGKSKKQDKLLASESLKYSGKEFEFIEEIPIIDLPVKEVINNSLSTKAENYLIGAFYCFANIHNVSYGFMREILLTQVTLKRNLALRYMNAIIERFDSKAQNDETIIKGRIIDTFDFCELYEEELEYIKLILLSMIYVRGFRVFKDKASDAVLLMPTSAEVYGYLMFINYMFLTKALIKFDKESKSSYRFQFEKALSALFRMIERNEVGLMVDGDEYRLVFVE